MTSDSNSELRCEIFRLSVKCASSSSASDTPVPKHSGLRPRTPQPRTQPLTLLRVCSSPGEVPWTSPRKPREDQGKDFDWRRSQHSHQRSTRRCAGDPPSRADGRPNRSGSGSRPESKMGRQPGMHSSSTARIPDYIRRNPSRCSARASSAPLAAVSAWAVP